MQANLQEDMKTIVGCFIANPHKMELSGSKIENIVLSEARISKTAFDEQQEKKERRFWR